MTIALPVRRPPFARPRATRSRSALPATTGHPRGTTPAGSPPAAPLAVALLGMLVVLGGLGAGAVALVVHLLRSLGG